MDKELHIKTTLYHKIISILSICLITGSFVYLLIIWNQLPDKVPGHYNGAGEINRWGSKFELLTCPIISVFMFAFISLIEKYPQIWNTGVNITKENQENVYRELKNMIVTEKLLVLLTFTVITINSSLAQPLPLWFLPVDLLLLFGSIGYFIFRLLRVGK